MVVSGLNSVLSTAPVHKESSKDNPAISDLYPLLAFAAREHILLSNLNRHLSDKNFLSPLQHGFRANLSRETQLVLTFHDWATIVTQHGQVDALLLDFSKAFDKVSHKKLTHKLAQYGISGKSLVWIAAFLQNQTQFTVVNA